MLLSVPLLASIATGCQPAQSQQMRPPTIAVYDLPVTRTVTDYEEFPGETDSPYSVQVRARVSGYMTNVYFHDGDMVKKGDKLFEIDPRMYKADLDRAEGAVKQYHAHVERLKKEYNRAKNLIGRGSISPEEHDRYKADYEEAEANLEVAIANRDLARLNLEWTEVRSPIDGLLSRRLVDPGNLIKADDTVLTSVVSLDPLYVYFDVHEQATLRIKRLMQQGKLLIKAQGLKEVPVDIGLSDETDFPHKGVVNFTDNRVDLNTGTLRFRAKIDNPVDAHGNRFIVPGLFVRVRLPIGNPHPALMVREQALVNDQGRKTVWVLTEKKGKDGRPEKDDKGQPKYVATVRDVGSIGVLRDGYREIEKGIALGDKVVVAGMQRLRQGLDVVPEPYDKAVRSGKAGEKVETAEAPTGQDPAAAKAALYKGTAAARIEGGATPAATVAPASPGEAAPVAAQAPGSDDSWRQPPPVPSGKGALRTRPETRPGRAGR
jgi:RND family efflux transporter MFP subunit